MSAHLKANPVQLSLREAAPAWVALLVVTILAWILTLNQFQSMGNGAGTMGMPFGLFVAMWTAMMFPSVAPVAKLISTDPWKKSNHDNKINNSKYGRKRNTT